MCLNAESPPRISIVIPCFNDGSFLQEALDSTHGLAHYAETILVNDGSTDRLTLDVINRAEQNGVQVIHQQNSGVAAARNHGIKVSKSKYILPLDADNRLRPEYLDVSLKILEQEPSTGVVYANRRLFGNRKGVLRVRDFDLSWLLMANFIDACAVFRRSVWEECGGYSTDMPVQGYEDWDLWIQAADKGWAFKHIDIVGFEYRVRKNSMSSVMTPKVELVREYLVQKYSRLYAQEYFRFGLWQTPSREFRHRPFYVLAQLIVRAWFPTILKRVNKTN